MDNVVVNLLQGAPLVVVLLVAAVVALWREVLKAYERVIHTEAKAADIMRPVIEQNIRTVEAMAALTRAIRSALQRLRTGKPDVLDGEDRTDALS